MEAVLFCGIQATGKSSFYKENYFNSHVRISMDLLRTRHREALFMDVCLETKQKFVIDNTNPTKEDRKIYIQKAKESGFKVIGYYFQSKLGEALVRNAQREGKQRIPDIGVRATYTKMEIPSYGEGFDELYYVETQNGEFFIKEWCDEV